MEYSAIRKNMDGHKDCHTECKSDREKCQMINLKKKDKCTYLQNRDSQTEKQVYGFPREKVGWG